MGVQIEKERDLETLRDNNQLKQAEGFNDRFYFALTVRGAGVPEAGLVLESQERMLTVLDESLPVDFESDAPDLAESDFGASAFLSSL